MPSSGFSGITGQCQHSLNHMHMVQIAERYAHVCSLFFFFFFFYSFSLLHVLRVNLSSLVVFHCHRLPCLPRILSFLGASHCPHKIFPTAKLHLLGVSYEGRLKITLRTLKITRMPFIC